MSTKSLVWLFVTIGSILGGYVPVLWHDSVLSVASLICSALGGIIGIWVGMKIGKSLNG